MTPLKAIRAKCLDCCGGQANEVRLCPCPDCTMYPFRFGNNPARKGKGGNPAFSSKTPIQVSDSDLNHSNESNYIPQPLTPEKEAVRA